jgi:hypothetical protein
MVPKLHAVFTHVVARMANNELYGRLSEEEFESMHPEPKQPKCKDERLASK